MKWPKINVRRMDVERVLIACSAALVLLLSVQSRNVEFEPYEEPLEEIPVADVSTASLAKRIEALELQQRSNRMEIDKLQQQVIYLSDQLQQLRKENG